ncbi:MAG TPA: ABC transporter permease [Aggregatilineaceae bacterium]|nr:ABC transporter permease [Aggregatilineaceae bacterium]
MSLPMYLARRLVFTIPLVIGISLVSFIIANAIPADPTAANLGERAAADPQIVAAFQHKWGLDKPVYLQYLTYVRNLMRGDLGTSIRNHRPVTGELRRFLPATVELSTAGILVSLVLGVLFGVVSAVWRNRPIDFVVRILSLIGVSAPVFWLALVCLLVFYLRLDWLPGPGRLDARLTPPPTVTGMYTVDSLIAGQWHIFDNAVAHLILPAIVLGAYSAGLIARVTRSSMLEVLSKEYMVTARSKGLPERTVIVRHGLRNALMPVVTVIGLSYGSLLSGAVLTETIFAWSGIGRYAYNAARTLDFPAIMGVSMLIAVIFIVTNLVVDMLYYALDPRIWAE